MPVSPSSLPNDSALRMDEGRHHRESTASVRLKAQRLRRSLDADRLDDAIKIAADVAAELRSSSAAELSPKAYYDVYLSVCAELRVLEMYVMESARRGAPVLELYERVQETPLILPRLYLLVTAGSVYIKSQQAPAKDVLRDLVEMCAGVQHPQRGLFLRAYLSQMMKDKLPDAFSDTEDLSAEDLAASGTVQDSIEFVTRNFTEMNRLWVRMQHDGSPREMELRERERLELRLLVGSNIATLSRLVGDNLSVYRDSVLPAILEQIVSCKDAIAQEYLADCVAQVFPDDFQLATLDAFMRMCGDLVKGVNMRTILVSIVDRLTRFSTSSVVAADAARAANAFHVLRTHIPTIVKRQGASLALTDRLRIYQSLMSFALTAEPDRTDYVDDVLVFCVVDMEAAQTGEHEDGDTFGARAARRENRSALDDRTGRALQPEDERSAVKVLSMPLEAFQSVGTTLKLENYVTLQRYLRYDNQKWLAARLLQSKDGYEPCIRDVGTLHKLFRFVEPLVRERVIINETEDDNADGEKAGAQAYERFEVGSLTHHHDYLLALMPVSHGTTAGGDEGSGGRESRMDLIRRNLEGEEEEDLEKNQELVARIVYLCESSDVENAMLLYSVIREELVSGGERRLALTLPSLVFASLRLAVRCGGGERDDQVERMLRFAGESVGFLGETSAVLALRLRLHVALTAASVGEGGRGLVYDNLAEAFVRYERSVTTAAEQTRALELITCAVGRTREALGDEAVEALGGRAVKHAGRMLTRSDQTVLLGRCARLMNGERAAEIVRRARDTALRCVAGGERVLLLLDVATIAVQLHEDGVCDTCSDGLLGGVLRSVREAVSGRRAKASPLGKLLAARYQRALHYIRANLHQFDTLDMAHL